ncbi:MAG: hypothetical protein MPJ50_03045 [Pirellulales bacterium]|nr:hypothetical protein [Pirellulales bacterium]
MFLRLAVTFSVLALKAELAILFFSLSGGVSEYSHAEIQEICEREVEATSSLGNRQRQRKNLVTTRTRPELHPGTHFQPDGSHQPAVSGHRLSDSLLAPLRC